MKARRRPPPPPQNASVPPAANKPLAVNGGGLRSSLAHGASLGTGAAIATEAVRAVFRNAPPEEKCANIQNQMMCCGIGRLLQTDRRIPTMYETVDVFFCPNNNHSAHLGKMI